MCKGCGARTAVVHAQNAKARGRCGHWHNYNMVTVHYAAVIDISHALSLDSGYPPIYTGLYNWDKQSKP